MDIVDNYKLGTYIKKRERNKKKNIICPICNNCTHKEKCKNRKDISLMKKCEKCKNCTDTENCDMFYITIENKMLVPIGRDENTGKLIRKSFSGKSKDEVYLNAITYMKDLAEGKIQIKSNNCSCPSILEIVTKYLNNQLNNNIIGECTYATNIHTLNRIKKEKFSSISIDKVKREDIEDFLSKEQVNGLSNSTLKKDYQMLKLAFDIAVERAYISIRQNYFTGKYGIIRPNSFYKSSNSKALTLKDEKKLLNYLDNSNSIYKNIILTLLHTGARVGEILALKVDDIDFNLNLIHIRRTTTKDKDGNVILGETTKTPSGIRDIPIIEILRPILKNAINSRIPNSENLIFCKPNGTVYPDNTINSAFKRILEKAGIEDKLTTHSLRHSFITRCNEANIPIAAIKSTVGHSDIHITMDVYNETQNPYMKKEQDKYSKYILNLQNDNQNN